MRGTANLKEVPESASMETPAVRKLDRLALLFEGILTVTERVHTGRQRLQDPEDFRVRMKKALDEVAAIAARRGYSRDWVLEGTFAVVAFLDEAILTTPDAGSANWVGRSLGEELFDQRSAGELFFKRLDALRADRDSQDLAEVLEVYYLCLLLGYEGRFAGGSKGELLQLMANLRERIGRIMGKDTVFSPDLELGEPPMATEVVADPMDRQTRLFALAALVFAMVCFVGLSQHLHSKTREIHRVVMERIATAQGSSNGGSDRP